MPRRNNRDEFTGRRGEHGPKRKGKFNPALAKCTCDNEKTCEVHPNGR
jgi:hypothetical protein